MQNVPFPDRVAAGRALARELERFRGPDTVVLGVPRGGVVVAAEVARALASPLDVIVARKLGLPGQPECAIGAVAGDAPPQLDEEGLRLLGIPPEYVIAETERQRVELRRREALYRGDTPPLPLAGKTVLVVDDGLATGFTVAAALHALRAAGVARLIAAAPVAAPNAVRFLSRLADEVIAVTIPLTFRAVGHWYVNFDATSDAEVIETLRGMQEGP